MDAFSCDGTECRLRRPVWKWTQASCAGCAGCAGCVALRRVAKREILVQLNGFIGLSHRPIRSPGMESYFSEGMEAVVAWWDGSGAERKENTWDGMGLGWLNISLFFPQWRTLADDSAGFIHVGWLPIFAKRALPLISTFVSCRRPPQPLEALVSQGKMNTYWLEGSSFPFVSINLRPW